MLTKERIDQFYSDVEALKLRFPVAEIHRMTGFSKGQISQVLGKTLTPSEDLIKEFYKSLNKVPGADPIIAYERIIEEKEARRRDAEAWAQKMEAHYNDMRNALERAQLTINEVLKPIKEKTEEILSNSSTTLERLSIVETIVRSDDTVIMNNQDRQIGNEVGASSKEAGSRQLAADKMRKGKGSQAGAGKPRT
jgi:hypothetical protein